jgi:hypothetical protein
MTTLDVTDVLGSPEFQTSFVVHRKNQSVNPANGRAAESYVSGFPSTERGVVYPASGSKMARSPEGESVVADIVVVSKFKLTEGVDGVLQADVVTWNGRDYTVMNTNDYSQYGQGFIEAICVKKTIN